MVAGMSGHNFILAFAVCLLAGLLSACMTSATVPDDHFYRLPAIRATEVTGPRIEAALAVGPIAVDGLYRERNMLYIDESDALELRRYHYRYWVQAPDELVRQYLMDYLRATKAADNITRYRPGNQGGGVIEGRILRFERMPHHGRASIEVSLVLQYRDSAGQDQAQFERRYSREVDAANGSMHATVVAFGDALQQIFGAFLQELSAR